jgi:SAM-dependent methyltransferase
VSRVSGVTSPGRDDPTGYDEAYYQANGQAGDRPALRLYTRIVARYTDSGPYLDFGCGTGHLLRHLSGLGPASGFEISEYSATAARKNAPGCEVVTDPGDIPSDTFGALTSVHVLEHLEDAVADETLLTWRRVLRPGGLAFVVMPDPGGKGRRLSGEDWVGYTDPTHINLKPHAEWRRFVSERGFDVLREGSDGLWNVPYSRLPKLLDAGVHAVPSFVQFLAGRMLLRPGTGESSFFLLRRSDD